jgi:two-component system CheB/CheR fusion protein
VEKSVTCRDQRWFTARIMPYRTLENRIDGVVVTFVDITAGKVQEAELRQARDELASLLASKTIELSQTHATLQAERTEHRSATGLAEDAPEGAP